MSELPELHEAFGRGYRDGFVKGYDDGIKDGRFQGYADAKRLAFQAVSDEPEATELLEQILGEQ